MFHVNKIVGWLLNPVNVGFLLVLAGGTLAFGIRCRRIGRWMMGVGLIWCGLWELPVIRVLLGWGLERPFPVRSADAYPRADVIVELGSGVWAVPHSPYADAKDCADRAWMAARLWKAGRASAVVPTGIGIADGDARLIADLGVPQEAIWVENRARNTEENIKFTRQLLLEKLAGRDGPVRVLLVTSASHLPRSLLLCKKYAPEWEAIPVAAENVSAPKMAEGLKFRDFIPDPVSLVSVNVFVREYVGYFGYRYFRR